MGSAESRIAQSQLKSTVEQFFRRARINSKEISSFIFATDFTIEDPDHILNKFYLTHQRETLLDLEFFLESPEKVWLVEIVDVIYNTTTETISCIVRYQTNSSGYPYNTDGILSWQQVVRKSDKKTSKICIKKMEYKSEYLPKINAAYEKMNIEMSFGPQKIDDLYKKFGKLGSEQEINTNLDIFYENSFKGQSYCVGVTAPRNYSISQKSWKYLYENKQSIVLGTKFGHRFTSEQEIVSVRMFCKDAKSQNLSCYDSTFYFSKTSKKCVYVESWEIPISALLSLDPSPSPSFYIYRIHQFLSAFGNLSGKALEKYVNTWYHERYSGNICTFDFIYNRSFSKSASLDELIKAHEKKWKAVLTGTSKHSQTGSRECITANYLYKNENGDLVERWQVEYEFDTSTKQCIIANWNQKPVRNPEPPIYTPPTPTPPPKIYNDGITGNPYSGYYRGTEHHPSKSDFKPLYYDI